MKQVVLCFSQKEYFGYFNRFDVSNDEKQKLKGLFLVFLYRVKDRSLFLGGLTDQQLQDLASLSSGSEVFWDVSRTIYKEEEMSCQIDEHSLDFFGEAATKISLHFKKPLGAKVLVPDGSNSFCYSSKLAQSEGASQLGRYIQEASILAGLGQSVRDYVQKIVHISLPDEQGLEYKQKYEVIRGLLEKKPSDVNTSCVKAYRVPLIHTVACSALIEMTKLILRYQPDLSQKNVFDQTVFERLEENRKVFPAFAPNFDIIIQLMKEYQEGSGHGQQSVPDLGKRVDLSAHHQNVEGQAHSSGADVPASSELPKEYSGSQPADLGLLLPDDFDWSRVSQDPAPQELKGSQNSALNMSATTVSSSVSGAGEAPAARKRKKKKRTMLEDQQFSYLSPGDDLLVGPGKTKSDSRKRK